MHKPAASRKPVSHPNTTAANVRPKKNHKKNHATSPPPSLRPEPVNQETQTNRQTTTASGDRLFPNNRNLSIGADARRAGSSRSHNTPRMSRFNPLSLPPPPFPELLPVAVPALHFVLLHICRPPIRCPRPGIRSRKAPTRRVHSSLPPHNPYALLS
ncbi:hypothetical protein LX36DRAFT_652130 [Colletotrichum falcatum]|nr:hypothetical protein LX36DRAFT_652130 [Colletotrichum falcatum]